MTIYPLKSAHPPLYAAKGLITFLSVLILLLIIGFLSHEQLVPPAEEGRTPGEFSVTITNSLESGTPTAAPYRSGKKAFIPKMQPVAQPKLTETARQAVPVGRKDIGRLPAKKASPAASSILAQIEAEIAALPGVPSKTSPGALAGNKGLFEAIMDAIKDASHVVYVVDRSGSMGGGSKLNKALLVMAHALESLNRDIPAQVILFDSRLESFDPQSGRFTALTGSLTLRKNIGPQLREAAKSVKARGGTRPSPAIEKASQALAGAPKGVLVLCSDGEFSAGEVARIKAANVSKQKIACIVIGGNASGANNLQSVAKQSGGAFSSK